MIPTHHRTVLAEHGPRFRARAGYQHPLYAHAASRVRDGGRKITPSTTSPEAPPPLVIYVPEASARTLDNHRPRVRSSPRSRPRTPATPRPEGALEGLSTFLVLSCAQGSGPNAVRRTGQFRRGIHGMLPAWPRMSSPQVTNVGQSSPSTAHLAMGPSLSTPVIYC